MAITRTFSSTWSGEVTGVWLTTADVPGGRGDRDPPASFKVPSEPSPAAREEEVQPLQGQVLGVGLEQGPGALVVPGPLGDHVGHQEDRQVVRQGPRPVLRGAHVAPVVAGPGVLRGVDLGPARRQRGVDEELARAPDIAQAAGVEVPAHPVGLALGPAVREGVLQPVDQVILGVVDVILRVAGVPEEQLEVDQRLDRGVLEWPAELGEPRRPARPSPRAQRRVAPGWDDASWTWGQPSSPDVRANRQLAWGRVSKYPKQPRKSIFHIIFMFAVDASADGQHG